MRRILAILIVLATPAAGFWFASQVPVAVVIVHTNDLHGQLMPRAGVGGIAEIATIIRRARPHLIFDAGDLATGTFLSDEFKGEPTIRAMNEIGYTSGTIGNHEFDHGQDALRALLRQAKFPVLSANLETPIPEIKKYTVVTVKGIRFGVIGLTTEEVKTKTHPKSVSGVGVLGIVQTLEKLLPEVRQKSDFLIATVHLEDDEEIRLANAFPEIRLIIGGHNHSALGPIKIGQTLVAKTGSSGRNVGRIDLRFNDRKIVQMDAKLIPVKDTPPDREIMSVLQPFNDRVDSKMSEILGEATEDFFSSRTTESTLADAVADAFREKARTQIALHNIGGIRAALPKGMITWGDVFEVLPFQNTLVTLKLSGAQLKRTLEAGAGMLAVSGVRVQFDVNKPAGKRLISASLLDGAPLEDSQFYSLVTNDFVLAGGDGFTEFAKGSEIVDTGYLLREAFVEYVKARRILSPKLDGRIVFD
jgi:2',3'-cyclic-nucleotide 2'-phosphodiesterase (5'-nucleotidase family)